MTLFLTLCIVLCLCIIAILWAWYRDLKISEASLEDRVQSGTLKASLADATSRLTTSEDRLADAELRIAAATENLTNQPRVIVEDEYPF